MLKEYWFEIPPNPGVVDPLNSSYQITITANNIMEMLEKLEKYDNWRDAVFLGYSKPEANNETRTKKITK